MYFMHLNGELYLLYKVEPDPDASFAEQPARQGFPLEATQVLCLGTDGQLIIIMIAINHFPASRNCT